MRFPGFKDKWKEKAIENMAEISSGGTPSRTNASYWNGNIPWVSTSLIDFNIIHYTDERITEEGLKKSSAKLFPKGSLLMAMYGQGKTRGKVAVLGIEASTNQACASIIPNSNYIDSLFLFQNLSKRYEEIRELSNQGGQQNLSGTIIKGIRVKFPTLPEQKKIAAFLTLIDERIETQNKIIEKLESLSKAFKVNVFNRRLQFKDDDGNDFADWNWKLGNTLFENVSDKNHNSDLPILAITQEHGAIPRHMIDYNISVSDKSIESYKVVQKGDFIISLRSFQGGIEFSNYEGICSPAYIVLRPIREVNPNFFRLYFKTTGYIKRLTRNLEGIRDGKMISFKYFSEVTLPTPSIEEQTKITNFLSFIERKIETERNVLARYENQKYYLLQTMFI
ncbi:restriction endonuclease subunit S [Nemorincola caseinilytica]|uniref:Restriction endonuclease subunit S n=1 Tax=Nemorincola caseinilytica TaxID=2054315 RepID=A0ABP8NGC0_9BACT